MPTSDQFICKFHSVFKKTTTLHLICATKILLTFQAYQITRSFNKKKIHIFELSRMFSWCTVLFLESLRQSVTTATLPSAEIFWYTHEKFLKRSFLINDVNEKCLICSWLFLWIQSRPVFSPWHKWLEQISETFVLILGSANLFLQASLCVD